jgi:hypothetical protein
MAAEFTTEDGGKMAISWPDTHSDLERLQVERQRQMPAWRKMELVAEMTQSVRTLALAGLRQRYPPTHRPTVAAAWPTCCWGRNWRRGRHGSRQTGVVPVGR